MKNRPTIIPKVVFHWPFYSDPDEFKIFVNYGKGNRSSDLLFQEGFSVFSRAFSKPPLESVLEIAGMIVPQQTGDL